MTKKKSQIEVEFEIDKEEILHYAKAKISSLGREVTGVEFKDKAIDTLPTKFKVIVFFNEVDLSLGKGTIGVNMVSEPKDLIKTPLRKLHDEGEFDARVLNICPYGKKLENLEDFLEFSEEEIRRERNVGKETIEAIKKALYRRNMSFREK